MREAFRLFLDFLWWLARRPRLTVRIMVDDVLTESGVLRFEVENRSASVTSLKPEIRCKYYYVSKRRIKSTRNKYFVRQSDRQLQPFRAVVLEATPDKRPEHYFVAWFRTYTFRPAQGIPAKVRIRNALLEPVGYLRFKAQVLRFRLLGSVRDDGSSSVDDFQRLKRSLGPH